MSVERVRQPETWLCFLVCLVLSVTACSRPDEKVTDPPTRDDGHVHELMTDDGSGDSITIEEDTIEVDSQRAETPEAWSEAMEFRDQVIAAVQAHGWNDPVTAFSDGYHPMLGSTHWVNEEFIEDGKVFDPTAPEFLMVVDDVVVGTMFLAPDDEPDDPPGAPYVRWHYHTYNIDVCFDNGVATGVPTGDDKECPNGGTASRKSPLMAHVWLVDIEDPFTDDMDAYRPE